VGRNLIKLAQKMEEIPVGCRDEQSMESQALSTRPAAAKPPFGAPPTGGDCGCKAPGSGGRWSGDGRRWPSRRAATASGEERTRQREGFFLGWLCGLWAIWAFGIGLVHGQLRQESFKSEKFHITSLNFC